jgi:hypothetical protein
MSKRGWRGRGGRNLHHVLSDRDQIDRHQLDARDCRIGAVLGAGVGTSLASMGVTLQQVFC